MTSRPTLDDVALAAGVSKATASKVFNDHDDIATATAERVREAAETLGYRSPARRRAGATRTIAVVADTLVNYYLPNVLSGLLDEAAERDVVITLNQSQPSPSLTPKSISPKWMATVHRGGVQGFVFITTPLTPPMIAEAARLHAPLVVIDPLTRPPAEVTAIGATNFRGGMDAVDHLLALGHRRIAIVGANADSLPGSERIAGYIEALRRAGIPVDQDLIRPGLFRAEDGAAITQLLRGPDRPTAVFAASDAVAYGVSQACHDVGLRVPDDISIVGFDDGLGAEVASPPLTTVRQPLAEMGRMALRACVSRIQNPDEPAPPVELATRLVVRESTAPPAG